MPRTRFEFDQVADTEFASQLELEQVQDNNANPVQFVPSTMNNYALYLKNLQSGYASLGQIVFGGEQRPYYESNNSNWDVAGRFFFPGSDTIGTPIGFKFVGELRNGTGQCRVYDVDNNNVIVLIDYSATTWDTFSSSSLSNIPTDEAVWEIQIREHPTLTSNKARISCGQLVF